MQYIQVNSVNEFNQTKQNFIRMGYKVIRMTPNSVQLEKNEFNGGIFIILLLLLVIGGIIYWAVTSGRKDEVLITLQSNNNNPAPTAAPIKEIKAENTATVENKQAVKYCSECGTPVYSEKSRFCPSCGYELD